MWLPLVEVLISGSSASTAPQDGDRSKMGWLGLGLAYFGMGGGGWGGSWLKNWQATGMMLKCFLLAFVRNQAYQMHYSGKWLTDSCWQERKSCPKSARSILRFFTLLGRADLVGWKGCGVWKATHLIKICVINQFQHNNISSTRPTWGYQPLNTAFT